MIEEMINKNRAGNRSWMDMWARKIAATIPMSKGRSISETLVLEKTNLQLVRVLSSKWREMKRSRVERTVKNDIIRNDSVLFR
jgi:hypothetical protein